MYSRVRVSGRRDSHLSLHGGLGSRTIGGRVEGLLPVGDGFLGVTNPVTGFERSWDTPRLQGILRGQDFELRLYRFESYK